MDFAAWLLLWEPSTNCQFCDFRGRKLEVELVQSNAQFGDESKGMLWTGRVLSGLMALLFVLDGVGHLMKPAPVVQAFARLEYLLSASAGIGALALICTALYVTPRRSVFGSIVRTGNLMGAGSS